MMNTRSSRSGRARRRRRRRRWGWTPIGRALDEALALLGQPVELALEGEAAAVARRERNDPRQLRLPLGDEP